MQPIDQNSATTEIALQDRQTTNALFVATCRAHPQSTDAKDALPLDAGDYQVAWAHPADAKGKQLDQLHL